MRPSSWCFEIFVDLEWTKYMVVIFLLLLLESAMAADILLNSDWEKVTLTSFLTNYLVYSKNVNWFHVLYKQDLPDDPTGRFHDFKEFVKSNFDIFKWIGSSIILAQVIYFCYVILWREKCRKFSFIALKPSVLLTKLLH